MEHALWLVVVAQVLGVQPDEVFLILLAAGAGVAGGLIPGPAGAALRKLSGLLSSKRQ